MKRSTYFIVADPSIFRYATMIFQLQSLPPSDTGRW